ncbi:hypothetical protein LTR29_010323 [Friedmanniomyces endolithicus]|nr:hypothetical protein LTR29_010323 [Friedmanniomyces endolithicus]
MPTDPEPPEPAVTATATVLNTPELLELILQTLPTRTLLLRATLTSHHWHATITALLRTNPSIRKRLFLQPATLPEMLALEPLELLLPAHRPPDDVDDDDSSPPPWHFANATWDVFRHPVPTPPAPGSRRALAPPLAVINPFVFGPPLPPDTRGMDARTASLRPLKRGMLERLAPGGREGLPGRMFVTQPPVAQHAWCLTGSAVETTTTLTTTTRRGRNRCGGKGAGDSYLRFMDGYDGASGCWRGVGELMEGLERGWVASGLGCAVDWKGARLVLGGCVGREEVLERVRREEMMDRMREEGDLGLERLTIG